MLEDFEMHLPEVIKDSKYLHPYIIVDANNGEILSDANGYGFRTKESAMKHWDFVTSPAYEQLQKVNANKKKFRKKVDQDKKITKQVKEMKKSKSQSHKHLKRSQHVNLLLPPEIYKQLKDIAKAKKMSVNNIFNILASEYVKENLL